MKTINNNNAFYLIAAVTGMFAFFIPWFNLGVFGQPSGYDLLTFGRNMGEKQSWLLILLPGSFLFISVFRALKKTVAEARSIKVTPLAR